jgi:hypothetical protein
MVIATRLSYHYTYSEGNAPIWPTGPYGKGHVGEKIINFEIQRIFHLYKRNENNLSFIRYFLIIYLLKEISDLSSTIKNYSVTDFRPEYAVLDSSMQSGVLNMAEALHNTSAV